MKEDEKKDRSVDKGQSSEAQELRAMTRRKWLQGVGGAALAAGLPATARGANWTPSPSQGSSAGATLPPGLYAPSREHLSRALESDDLFHAIPPGSETDYARPIAGEFKPSFFSQNEFHTIRRLISILLDLPAQTGDANSRQENQEGVVEAVAQFIDLRVSSAAVISEAARSLSPEHRTLALQYYGREGVSRVETENPEKTCREGFAWLDQASQRERGVNFLGLTAPQQIGIIKTVSDDRPDFASESAGTRFFHFLKVETIRGYYTSRAGLKELDDKSNTFYVVSPGCADERNPDHGL